MIIAHRGASGTAPENTLAAFRRASELGADWWELDVCTSLDGEVIVFHDDSLERTTNGRGLVRHFTLAELKRLDAGRWFHQRFAGERIPTLREVIVLAKTHKAGLLIEMKPGPHLGHGFEEKIASLLGETGRTEHDIVMSFNHTAVARVHGAEPRLRTLLLVGRRANPGKLADSIHAHRAVGVSVKHSLASKHLVDTMHARGLLVVVWTVNSVRAMKQFVTKGVDGITTNYPELLVTMNP